MKYLNYILIFSVFFLCIECISNTVAIKENDKKKIEKLLFKHKRYAFLNLYEKSIIQEEKKYRIKKTDSLCDLSSTELYHDYCLVMDFYSEDHPSYENKNYDIMINRWLRKDYPIPMSTDDPNLKVTMTFKKALDFYESEDLDKYIDSLRNVFYKKYEENNLRSLECLNGYE